MTNSTALSKEEFQQMIQLLHRYIDHNMEQWASWKLKSRFGETYIDISAYNKGSKEAYDDLSLLLSQEA